MFFMRRHVLVLLTLLLSACAPSGDQAGPAPDFANVFESGGEGYPSIRIPSLITSAQGTLLAFAEGRVRPSDHAENDIVLKLSSDGGRTWSPLQVIAEDGQNCLNNPQAVVLPDTGRILLVYQVFPNLYHARRMGDDIQVAGIGYDGPTVQRSFIIHSDDDGHTWSAPREITTGVKRPGAAGHASGPGIGIVLRRGPHKGRIVMPFNETVYPGDGLEPADRVFHVYAAFSDDAGKTWQYGENAPADPELPGQAGYGNEVQMIERIDGSVLLNARSAGGPKLRKTAVSTDGGQTWSALTDDPQLPEPNCMAGFLRYADPLDGEESLLLFSSPTDPKRRAVGTIRLSRDEGETWSASRVLVPEGQFAYSSLTRLPGGDVGLLFETEDYDRIDFARFPLDWIESGDE